MPLGGRIASCRNMSCDKFAWVKKHGDDEYYMLKAEINDMKQEFAIMKAKLTVLEKKTFIVLIVIVVILGAINIFK